ncbi:MAG: DUF7310 family coiled-coil domain-containing protein [Halodesulfurarchaeum sp.]
MPERRTIDDRLSALERRLDERGTVVAEGSQAKPPAAESTDGPVTTGTVEDGDLLERVEALEAEIAELEAGLQALRGYVGNVDHVNETVERRANAAIAAVERLESAPKTPPPIATATPDAQASEESVQKREPPRGAADQSDPETADGGILDRLRALR